MANICDYKVIVKGRKNACYAFYGSMPAYNDKYIIKEKGTDEEYILGFGGDCKWAVDHYSKNWNGSFNIVLPDDPDEAMEEAQEKYRDICIEDRSKLFQVNVFCNSADIEDFDPAEGPNEIYVHYKNGRYIPGKCPDALRIAKEYDKEPIEEVKAAFPIIIPIEKTNYEGRNERIENVKVGDPLVIKTDYYNRFYDPVAIEVFNMKNETLGYLRDGFEWESSFQIAKHIDKLEARVASVTPLSQLAKNAKYALMDVELLVKEDCEDEGYDDDKDYAEDEEVSFSKEEVFELFEHMVEFAEILDSTEEFADKLADDEYNWQQYLRSDLLTFLLYINNVKKGFDDHKIETLNFVYGEEHTIEHYKELSEQITEGPDPDSIIMRGCVAYDITSCVANLMDDDDDEIMFSSVLVRLYKEMAKLFTLYDSDARTENIIKTHIDAMEKCAKNLVGNLFNTHDENEENGDEDYEEIKKLFEEYDEKELIDGCEIIDGALKKYTGTGKNVVIPDGVTIISDEAFSGCESLISITIPDTVTSIGSKAFKDCENLTSITIPNGVTSIEWDTFDGCKSLISVIIPDSVNNIDTSAFCGCENLTSITIPNGVTSIGWSAFGGCRSLTSITIPDSVTHIEGYAFFRCSGLTSITIPNGVQHIGNCAFRDCENLKSITIPDSVTCIGECAFEGTAYYEEEVIKEKTIEELRTVFPIIKAIEGTAYEGRIARIENVKVGDPLIIKADYNNPFYTPVAIEVFNMNNETLGYLEKSDIYGTAVWLPFSQIAKNIDKLEARVVSVTPLSKRRKNAKYALMDVELSVKGDYEDEDED